MDKTIAAIEECNKEKIVECIAGLPEFETETLSMLLNSCKSEALSIFVKQEFTKQRDMRACHEINKEPKDIQCGSTDGKLNTQENTLYADFTDKCTDSEDQQTASVENPRNREDESAIELGDSKEILTEEEAIKKYSFNNSKYDKALEMFLSGFKTNIGDVDFDKAAKLSRTIVEVLIKTAASTFPKEVRSKSHNLKENSKLCNDLYNFVIVVEEFVKMLPSEMQTEERKSKDIESIRESLLASQVATTAADTDMFRCSRCKEKKCTYTQLQTRSCDEAMTTFVTCTNCGHRWKF